MAGGITVFGHMVKTWLLSFGYIVGPGKLCSHAHMLVFVFVCVSVFCILSGKDI